MSEKTANGAASHLIVVEIPAEVAAAAMTQRPDLLSPLMARLQKGDQLPQGQVIAMVQLIGHQINQLFKVKQQLDEVGHAVESLNQAEKHVDSASDRLREQLEVTTKLLLEMNVGK
jgi:uncharacterized protein YcgI (DUF1989 family)